MSKLTSIPPYIPPLPTAPNTIASSLAVVHTDKKLPYTVNVESSDRSCLYSMFSDPNLKFYVLNMTTTWFWGDGTSSREGDSSFNNKHEYDKSGTYDVVVQMDMAFIGGKTCRIISGATISVPEPVSDPNVIIDPLGEISGNKDSSPSKVAISCKNTGGRVANAKPFAFGINGTISDIDKWISFDTNEILLPNDGKVVTFYMTINWEQANWSNITLVGGKVQIGVNLQIDVLNAGFYVKFQSANII